MPPRKPDAFERIASALESLNDYAADALEVANEALELAGRFVDALADDDDGDEPIETEGRTIHAKVFPFSRRGRKRR